MPRSNAEYRWTEPKAAEFLRHLAQSGSVTMASARVGMSRQSAYVRARANRDFCAGWDRALSLAHAARIEALGAGETPLQDSVNSINFVNLRDTGAAG